MQTVYYLVHVDSNRRVKYYRTQAGARIAMRLRNQHLGFTVRQGRDTQEPREYELYRVEGQLVQATYCIEEDTIDTPDLLE
jgi:hypothetical protein